MTRSTVKRLTKPLGEPEIEFRMLMRAAWRLQQNESLAIARRNLFDAEESSSNNTGANPPTPPKTLHEHSYPNPSCYASSISPSKEKRKLDQFAQFRFNSLTEEEGWNRIEEYVQYQDDLWDNLSPPMNVSSISEAMQPTFRGRLKRACNQISYLETPARKVRLKNPYLIYDYCEGSHEADECKQNDPAKQACLSGGDIYDDPSLMRKSETSEPEAPTFAITTRSGVSTQDPPFSAPSQSTSANHIEGETKKEGPEDAESSIIQEPAPRPSIFYQPSKSSNLPFP
ncbi:hypothetical protein Tco_1005512, partial [Tanacetum coccineum]